MTRKKDPEVGLAPEKWPATTEALKDMGGHGRDGDLAARVANTIGHLLVLEELCSHGGAVGLTEIRGLLKALRG